MNLKLDPYFPWGPLILPNLVISSKENRWINLNKRGKIGGCFLKYTRPMFMSEIGHELAIHILLYQPKLGIHACTVTTYVLDSNCSH